MVRSLLLYCSTPGPEAAAVKSWLLYVSYLLCTMLGHTASQGSLITICSLQEKELQEHTQKYTAIKTSFLGLESLHISPPSTTVSWTLEELTQAFQ